MLCTFFYLLSNIAFAAPTIGKAPIAVDADALEVLQTQNKAIFTGNVVATQQDMTLKADKMTIHYHNAAEKQQKSAAFGALSRIEVLGRVRMTTPTESADADRGLYDADKEKIFLYGTVILRKDGNILNGSALQYDMNTGASLLTGGVQAQPSDTAKTGKKPARVRGIFVPKEEQ
jgi:lipopolysaccharide export system protein LptA